MAKLKRFSKKELLENKDKYKIRSCDVKTDIVYRIIENKKIIGYITFNQLTSMTGNINLSRTNKNYREYKIL